MMEKIILYKIIYYTAFICLKGLCKFFVLKNL